MAGGNVNNNKKFYWLKMDKHFFNNARIKKLRKIAGGDTYTIIYLKMMLLSIEYNGLLIYEGIEESFENEMALKLEEDEDNVRVTINYLRSQGLIEEKDGDFILPQAINSIGSETKNNVYKRVKSKERLEKFQSHSNPIPIPVQSHSNQIPIELEKEKELEIELEIECVNTAPSIEDIKNFVNEKKLVVNPDKFYLFYNQNNWTTKDGKKITKEDWQNLILYWNAQDLEKRNTRTNVTRKSNNDVDNYTKNISTGFSKLN